MHSISRIRASWQAMQSEKAVPHSRRSILRWYFPILLATSGTIFFIFFVALSISHLIPPRNSSPTYHLREDAFKHFSNHGKCPVTHSHLYQIPFSKSTPPTSPFCKNRATLLTAMSHGGRNSLHEPFSGKNCTYKWFSIPEICMILERHNAIVFVGDETAQSIYMALNTLLSEDLALGALQTWRLGETGKVECRCENQFSTEGCLSYAVRNSEDTKRNGGKTNAYFCGRVKHAYIPVYTTPAPLTSINLFKDLTYKKPHPWQPSPLVFSFAKDTATTTLALNEWTSLAAGAERNMPLLFVGGDALKNRIIDAVNAQEEIARVAREMHFDVLELYNLTLQATGRSGMEVALVEAMIVVNWLSKIPSS